MHAESKVNSKWKIMSAICRGVSPSLIPILCKSNLSKLSNSHKLRCGKKPEDTSQQLEHILKVD